MLARHIIAVTTALLLQVSVVLSSDGVGYDLMKDRMQGLNQEQGQNTQGHAQQTQRQGGGDQQCQSQKSRTQDQSTQCQRSKTQLSESQPTGGQVQQPQAQQTQTSQNQGQQLQSTNAGESGQCFLSNGSNDPSGIPCFSNDNTSQCCGADEFCSTNKLCVSKNDANKYSRGSCVDPTFQAASCPNICLSANDTGAVLPCGDPSLGEFCCDEGQGFACCSTPSKILTLGKGTTFTENSPKPSATSNSNPISQSQRSSQPETTRTETATATQTQTQISSATQTVVQTSVSISVQVITSTQSPTFTTSFSPAASATASTSIILVTQTTSKQTQPSNSLATAPSSSVFQNQNSQPTSSSTISNFNTQASSSINGDQNQNGGSTISSTTSSQASSKAQNQNQTDNRNNQTSLTNLLKSPNMTAIIVGVSVSILVVLVGIAAFYIRKRRRSKKSQVQLRDGIGRESGSDKGTFEKIGKKDRNEDASIGVFVTVSEKFKGFKEKAHNVHAKESDRVSREFDGALGGGMYLEGGTMGRGRRPQNSMYRGDMSTNSNNPPPIPSSFSNPRTPPPPPQLQQSRMSHNSGRSFMSASSGSQYSRATTGESVRIPLQSDMPVPYRTVGSENGGAYRMFSREEERDLDIGLGLGRMDGQPKEEPRGFF